jgi:hypothetical protein
VEKLNRGNFFFFEGVKNFELVVPPMGRSGYRKHTYFLGGLVKC